MKNLQPMITREYIFLFKILKLELIDNRTDNSISAFLLIVKIAFLAGKRHK